MGVDVDADDGVPQLREARRGDGADVSETDDDDLHAGVPQVAALRYVRGTRTYSTLLTFGIRAPPGRRLHRLAILRPFAGRLGLLTGGRLPRRVAAAVVKTGGTEIDIALYADVLRRHRTIVVVGVVLTLALVVLSVVRVSPSGIGFRSPQIWSNQSTIVLTQQGAPEFRSVLPSSGPGGTSSLADTSRFAGLIDVYTTLATSDAVVRMLERRGLIDPAAMANGRSPITAAAVVSTVGGGTTPMMTLTAQAPSAAKATKLTRGATNALVEFVEARQAAAKIPERDRIQLRVVKASDEPTLVKPRSKALPILVLLGGLFATAAFAFTRDNVARGDVRPCSNRRRSTMSRTLPRS